MPVQEDLSALEQLLEQVDALPDPIGRAPREAVELLVRVYGAALTRLVEHAARGASIEEIAGDEELEPLLLAHGLHPDDIGDRVERALEEVRPYVQSHDGEISLIGIDGDTAVVKMSGTCDGCASSETTLKTAVEQAVLAAAPELSAVRADASGGARTTLIPVDRIRRAPPAGVA
jgi:Fe-S cluster biogenesis protein NfuA